MTTRASRQGTLSARRAEGTLTDLVEVVLQEAIVAGKYGPGQKLPITTLAQEQDVSLGVVREALTRLTSDGLVTAEAMHGFTVMRTSVADLDEITELLKLLMATAIRRAVERGGAGWEASLIAAHHLFKRAVGGEIGEAPRSVEVDRAHLHFLETLTAPCGNERLIGLLASLQRSMRVYHRLAIGLLRDEAGERVASYGEVVRRAVEGDAKRAIRLMSDDIDSACAACRAYLQAEEPRKRRPGGAMPAPSRRRPRLVGPA